MIEIKDKIFGADHFSWHEALYLRDWAFHAYPEDKIKGNIINIAYKIEEIRKMFGEMIMITSWYRPPPYNKLVGGVADSYHMKGSAIDFFVHNKSCDVIRMHLVNNLDTLQIRMQNKPGAQYIHIDNGRPGKQGRFFI